LVAELGLTPEVRNDHAAYIASWLTVLQNETPRAARGRLSARLVGRIVSYGDRARGGGRIGRRLDPSVLLTNSATSAQRDRATDVDINQKASRMVIHRSRLVFRSLSICLSVRRWRS
jgi:hypothetical protein